MSNRIVDFDKFGINKFTIPTWENRKMPISPPESVEEYYRWVNDEGYLHVEVEVTGFGDRKLTMIIGNQVRLSVDGISISDNNIPREVIEMLRTMRNNGMIILFENGALIEKGRAHIITKQYLSLTNDTSYDVYLEY